METQPNTPQQPTKTKKKWVTPEIVLIATNNVEGGGPNGGFIEIHTPNQNRLTSSLGPIFVPHANWLNYHS